MMVYHKKNIFEPSQHPIDAFNSKRKVQGYNREIDTSDEEDDDDENSYLDDSFINDKTMLTQDISNLEVTPPPAFTQGPVKTRRQRKFKTFNKRLEELNKNLCSDQVQKKSSTKSSRRIVKFNSSSDEEN